MDFTRDDFFRGAVWALGSFLTLLLIAEIILTVTLDIVRTPPGPHMAIAPNLAYLPLMLGGTVLIGGPIAAICVLLGSPLAYRIARSLRAERRIAVHVLVFLLFGAVFGALCAGLVYAGLFAMQGMPLPWLAITTAAAIGAPFTAVATVIGWSLAAWHTLRRTRRARRRTRRDVDAVAEDAR